MDASVQDMAGCRIGQDYPAPIIDDRLAMQAAKDRMYGLRQSTEAQQEANAVQARHGSRKSGLPPSGQRRNAGARQTTRGASSPAPQGDLFA
jgi:deoxyribodipyrimidine photo-lyase